MLRLASVVRSETSAEDLRVAADLARTLDALLVEEVAPSDLRTAVTGSADLAKHWERSLAKLQLIYEVWPEILRDQGAIDLAERRNRLLHALAQRWENDPPPGFTIAAGITSAAPAVAALVRRVAHLPEGTVILPGLWLDDIFPMKNGKRSAPTKMGGAKRRTRNST